VPRKAKKKAETKTWPVARIAVNDPGQKYVATGLCVPSECCNSNTLAVTAETVMGLDFDKSKTPFGISREERDRFAVVDACMRRWTSKLCGCNEFLSRRVPRHERWVGPRFGSRVRKQQRAWVQDPPRHVKARLSLHRDLDDVRRRLVAHEKGDSGLPIAIEIRAIAVVLWRYNKICGEEFMVFISKPKRGEDFCLHLGLKDFSPRFVNEYLNNYHSLSRRDCVLQGIMTCACKCMRREPCPQRMAEATARGSRAL